VTFEDALAAAQVEKKLVVVDFQSADSEASKRLEKMTIPESRVKSFLQKKVVAIRVDLAASKELAARFRVESAPTVLFVDAQGLEVDRYVGFLEPGRFADQARGTLAGKDALFRAKARIAAGEKNPRARLELAQLFVDRGMHAEALEQLLVCFDRGAIDDPTFAETRSTEVLRKIHRLGQVWPDALAKLAERSDAAAKKVLAGSTDPNDVDEAIRIDEELGRVERLTALYDKLKPKPEAGRGAQAAGAARGRRAAGRPPLRRGDRVRGGSGGGAREADRGVRAGDEDALGERAVHPRRRLARRGVLRDAARGGPGGEGRRDPRPPRPLRAGPLDVREADGPRRARRPAEEGRRDRPPRRRGLARARGQGTAEGGALGVGGEVELARGASGYSR
jgi:hypothetical protein